MKTGRNQSSRRGSARTSPIYKSSLDLPLFNRTLVFAMGKTASHAREALKVFKLDHHEHDGCLALCCQRGTSIGIFFGLNDLKVGTLAHETTHATQYIMDSHNMPIKGKAGMELQAMLSDFIFEWAYRQHWNAKRKLIYSKTK